MAKTFKTKSAAKPDEAAAPAADSSFQFGGKKYKVTKGARVPLANGAMTLTAADIAVSEEAQKYLVENNCNCIDEEI